jgi:hypothetical protein
MMESSSIILKTCKDHQMVHRRMLNSDRSIMILILSKNKTMPLLKTWVVTKTMKTNSSVAVSLIWMFVLVRSVAKLLSKKLICSKSTQAFTWVHTKLLSKLRI